MWTKNKKGFTLAELLIVVAIIGVLVAISIPIFSSQLEKAREAVDLANLRSAYAVGCTKLMTEDPDNNQTPDGMSYYIYIPTNGELITYDTWHFKSEDEKAVGYVGKGTKTIGSPNNKISETSGIQYDPGKDVSGYPILVYI